MTTEYFEYPWRGNVYKVDLGWFANEASSALVKIPDSNEIIRLRVRPGYFPEVFELKDSDGGYDMLAELMFCEEDTERKFEGSWDPIIPLIDAAAGVNTLFRVVLTLAEYHNLKDKGGFTKLKKRLSPKAASLVELNKESAFGAEDGLPSLELLRTGSCPY